MLRSLTLVLLLAVASTKAAAQWSISADLTAARFWGGADEQDGDRALRPYRPTMVGVGLERSLGRLSVSVHGYYGSASLGLEGADAVVAVKDALDVYGASLELSRSVAAVATDSRIIVAAGPLIERWSLAGETSHVRAGFGMGLGLGVSLGGRWRANFRGRVAVSGSPFADADLDPGFAPRALWRREVVGRVQFRL